MPARKAKVVKACPAPMEDHGQERPRAPGGRPGTTDERTDERRRASDSESMRNEKRQEEGSVRNDDGGRDGDEDLAGVWEAYDGPAGRETEGRGRSDGLLWAAGTDQADGEKGEMEQRQWRSVRRMRLTVVVAVVVLTARTKVGVCIDGAAASREKKQEGETPGGKDGVKKGHV